MKHTRFIGATVIFPLNSIGLDLDAITHFIRAQDNSLTIEFLLHLVVNLLTNSQQILLSKGQELDFD